jgi:hypothetical protein
MMVMDASAFKTDFVRVKMNIDAENDNQLDTPRPLSAAARRALQEAEARRAQRAQVELPEEKGGRGGADPARFGDWEINGRAIDF